MGLVSELRRRNVLRMAVLYAVAAWLIMQVAEVMMSVVGLPAWAGRTVFVLLGVGFPIALIFSWFYELTPEGISLETDVDLQESITHVTGRRLDFIVISLLCAGLILFAYDKWWIGPPPEKSIAVLPFENMSGDPEQEFFSDGLSDTLIHVLAQVSGLKVTATTSSFYFKGKNVDVVEIARQLKVGTILEGSVQKAGNRVRVIAQLVNARDGTHLWSETYDRELKDVFAIQTEISGQIVRALKVALGAGEQEALAHAQKPTENLEAYELYLRGRYFWQRRGEDNIRHAVDLLEDATELDPQFARAWSSLAAALITLPQFSEATYDMHYPRAVSVAQRALALDDNLAEAYAVIGEVVRQDKKWAEAEGHYLRAIASEPKNATAHLWYGEHLASVGRVRDALEETLIAYRLDPLHPGTNMVLAWIYFFLKDLNNALKYGAAAWELGNDRGLYVQGIAHLRLGEVDRAMELAEQYERAEKFNSRVQSFRILVSSHAGFGRIDDAYRAVSTNLDLLRANAWWVLWQPDMVTFRQDPRFAALVTELGLLDYWRENGWPDACQPLGDSVSCE